MSRLAENTPLLPPIRFYDVDSHMPKCKLADVLLPAQSFLARVPESIPICTKDESLAKFRELEDQINTGNVAGNPWSHVNIFGKAGFYTILCQVHKSFTQKPKSAFSSRSFSGSNSPSTSARREGSPGKENGKLPLNQESLLRRVVSHKSLNSLLHLNLKCT